MLRSSLLFLAVAAVMPTFASAAPGTTDLSGQWRFSMDRQDVGVKESWFSKDLSDKIKLPGSLQFQGFGDDISTSTQWVAALPRSDPDDPGSPFTLKRWYLLPEYKQYTVPGNIKNPYLAQPVKHYLGVAWYQRDLEIPASAAGQAQHLFLERPRWESTVYLDDQVIGKNNSLVAPHEYSLGVLSPGKHRLSIRLDNRMSVFPGPISARGLPTPGYRPDGHSVSDALGQTWNGIAGRIELHSSGTLFIDDAQVFPDVASKSAKIKVHVGNVLAAGATGTLTAGATSEPVNVTGSQGADVVLTVPLGAGAATWDEFHPVLQHLTLSLKGGDGQVADTRELTFGLREIKNEGRKLLLNGVEIDIRGTHSGGDFPLTGYPATDVASWKKIIQTCKDYGINAFRFHSWCPPEECFTAADELGFYVQPECGMWNNFSNPGMADMLEKETQRMMRAYGNHPSYVMLSASNEPAGNYGGVLQPWSARWYQQDPRRLYCAGTGRSATGAGPTFFIGAFRGRTGWFGGDYSAALPNLQIPLLGHEVGQWCAYPDFDIIKKFTGYLQPSHYEIYRDSAVARGVIDRNKDWAWASGRFQVKCYKEEIEANLRTQGSSGFQLLDLHDYLGQGGALIGVLDTFWESKGYTTPEEFHRFCAPTVPLARLRSYVGTTADTFTVPVEIAHFGAAPLKNVTPYWKLVSASGQTALEGTLPAMDIAIGKSHLGDVSADLSKVPAPQQYRFVVGLRGEGASTIENDWNVWIYPAQVSADVPAGVLVTNNWAEAKAKLAAGGKVVFTPGANDLGRNSPQMKNTPFFWNRLMNPSAAGDAMLGLWVDAKHPALAEFPTEGFSDWQWIDMVTNVRSVNIDAMPKELRPIASAIDDWSRNYKLGVIFECKVGQGSLLVSAIDITNPTRPVAKQLKRSLVDYAASAKFQPGVALSPEQADKLWPGPNGVPAAPATSPISTAPTFNPGDVNENPIPTPATRPQ